MVSFSRAISVTNGFLLNCWFDWLLFCLFFCFSWESPLWSQPCLLVWITRYKQCPCPALSLAAGFHWGQSSIPSCPAFYMDLLAGCLMSAKQTGFMFFGVYILLDLTNAMTDDSTARLLEQGMRWGYQQVSWASVVERQGTSWRRTGSLEICNLRVNCVMSIIYIFFFFLNFLSISILGRYWHTI